MTDTSHNMIQDRDSLPERIELARRPVDPRRTADSPEDVILVFLPWNRATPFVTWRENTESRTTYWGHYFHGIQAAVTDFEDR